MFEAFLTKTSIPLKSLAKIIQYFLDKIGILVALGSITMTFLVNSNNCGECVLQT